MAAHDDDREAPTRRQLARKARRDDGDRSARLAHALMALPLGKLNRLGLDAELRAEVDRSRRITALSARRREERRLAGVLRTVDADDVQARLAKVQAGGDAEERPFHMAEAWRTRLLAPGPEGPAALAALCEAHPTADATRLSKLVEDGLRERATGKPPGAQRALFRAVMALLDAPAAVADRDDLDGDDSDDADDAGEDDDSADATDDDADAER